MALKKLDVKVVKSKVVIGIDIILAISCLTATFDFTTFFKGATPFSTAWLLWPALGFPLAVLLSCGIEEKKNDLMHAYLLNEHSIRITALLE